MFLGTIIWGWGLGSLHHPHYLPEVVFGSKRFSYLRSLLTPRKFPMSGTTVSLQALSIKSYLNKSVLKFVSPNLATNIHSPPSPGVLSNNGSFEQTFSIREGTELLFETNCPLPNHLAQRFPFGSLSTWVDAVLLLSFWTALTTTLSTQSLTCDYNQSHSSASKMCHSRILFRRPIQEIAFVCLRSWFVIVTWSRRRPMKRLSFFVSALYDLCGF